MKRFLILFFLSFLLFGFAGKVVKVSDGDTIEVKTADKQLIKVRLFGIDCPEKKQMFGQQAKRFTSKEVYGKTVEVEEKNKDMYGCMIGVVCLKNNVCLNADLLKAGYAWVYRDYYKGTEYYDYEKQARDAKLGLWGGKCPIAPWDWRRERKKRFKLLH
jgi:micrococcal nuclease